MTSLRVAMKLSLAENKESGNTTTTPSAKVKSEDEGTDGSIVRKRKHSAEFKERKKSRGDKSLASDSQDIGRQISEENFDLNEDRMNLDSTSSSHYDNTGESITDSKQMLLDEETNSVQDVHEERDQLPEENLQEPVEERPIEEEEVPQTSDEKESENVIQDKAFAPSMDESLLERSSEAIGFSESMDIGDADAGINVEDPNGDSQSAPKRRKKRTPSILKDLEIPPKENEGNPGEGEGEENAGRYQSSRTAAKLAKTKFAPGKGKDRASSEANAATTTGNKPGRKSGANKAAGVDQLEIQWIQCDSCGKWRSIPPSAGINMSDFADDKWFCQMNTWDEKRNNCEAEEEQYQTDTQAAQVAPAPEEGDLAPPQEKITQSAAKGRGKGKGKKAASQEADGKQDLKPADEAPPSGKKKGGPGKGSNKQQQLQQQQQQQQPGVQVGDGNATANAGTPAAEVNWVQCNRCKKWRKAPEVNNLPEKWFCSLNTWAPQFASCSVKQEEDDSNDNSNQHVLQQTPFRGGGGKKGAQAAAAAPVVPISYSIASAAQPTIKKTQWVQCERKGCKKWRKVPAHIDMSTFPEKWYCEMNSWNPDGASCDVPEDSDSENDNVEAEIRAQSIVATNAKLSALSYRRIIFGNDGKIKVCFSDKNKTGYGLYSSVFHVPRRSYDLETLATAGLLDRKNDGTTSENGQAEEDDEEEEEILEPMKKIAYWWSCASKEGMNLTLNHPKDVGAYFQPTPLLDTIRRISSAPFPFLEEDHSEGSEGNKLSTESDLDQSHSVADSELIASVALSSSSIPPPPKFSFANKSSKTWEIYQSMTLLQKFKAESTIIRSAFLASNQQQLSFHSLYSFIIMKCKFLNPLIESVRQFFTLENFKDALHRLEENDEIEIFFTCLKTPMEMIIHLLTPLTTLRSLIATKSKIFNRKINHSQGNQSCRDKKWLKNGFPLKMRKFFMKKQSNLNALELQQFQHQQQQNGTKKNLKNILTTNNLGISSLGSLSTKNANNPNNRDNIFSKNHDKDSGNANDGGNGATGGKRKKKGKASKEEGEGAEGRDEEEIKQKQDEEDEEEDEEEKNAMDVAEEEGGENGEGRSLKPQLLRMASQGSRPANPPSRRTEEAEDEEEEMGEDADDEQINNDNDNEDEEDGGQYDARLEYDESRLEEMDRGSYSSPRRLEEDEDEGDEQEDGEGEEEEDEQSIDIRRQVIPEVVEAVLDEAMDEEDQPQQDEEDDEEEAP